MFKGDQLVKYVSVSENLSTRSKTYMNSSIQIKRSSTLSFKATEYLRKYLLDNYAKGGRIPGEHELAETLGVNRGTVRTALGNLEREGLVFRRQGDGTYVNPNVIGIRTRLEDFIEYRKLIQSSGYEAKTVQINVEVGKASDDIAKKINIPPGSQLLISSNLLFADNVPVIFVEDAIPFSLIKYDYENNELMVSVFEFLEERCNQRISYAVTEIVPRICGKEISKILKMDPCDAILQSNSIVYNQSNEPIMSSRTFFKEPFIRYHVVKRRKDISY
jgi:GntR family transcriptional regulator